MGCAHIITHTHTHTHTHTPQCNPSPHAQSHTHTHTHTHTQCNPSPHAQSHTPHTTLTTLLFLTLFCREDRRVVHKGGHRPHSDLSPLLVALLLAQLGPHGRAVEPQTAGCRPSRARGDPLFPADTGRRGPWAASRTRMASSSFRHSARAYECAYATHTIHLRCVHRHIYVECMQTQMIEHKYTGLHKPFVHLYIHLYTCSFMHRHSGYLFSMMQLM